MVRNNVAGSVTRLVLLLCFWTLATAIVFTLAEPNPSLHGKEGWNWGMKVGGEGKHGHAHGHGEVHADPKVGHSWVHGLDVKGSHGHYGSGHVKVVKLVRRNENHGHH